MDDRSGIVHSVSATSGPHAEWYWCLSHNAVEPGSGCRDTERMGPYPTREAAANWKQTVAERNEKWDAEDAEWE